MSRHKQQPLVSIVVLNWNGLDNTKICLEHLQKLDYPNYEVIVVDNGSRPDQKEYLSKLKDIIYVDNPINKGFTGGHIDGLAHASGEYIVLLNNDAVMKSNYLTKALEDLEDPQVAAVGGRSYFWNDEQPLLDESNQFYSYQEINVSTGEAFMKSDDYGQPQVVNNVSGSAVVMRRSVINEIGYLYDRFFAYFEETDLFARVKRAGYKVLYDPELRIWHRNGASSGASSGSYFFYYQIFRNRFIFAVRNFETKSLLSFLYLYSRVATGSLLRYLLRPHSDNRVTYKAYFKSAFYNVCTAPVAFGSRFKLRRQLGKSNYNHAIYGEQNGLSLILDCTQETPAAITTLTEKLAGDTNPLHEYVIVVRGKDYSSDFKPGQRNIRFVTDRKYFATSPLNLGCIAARYDWMAICSPADNIDTDHLHDAVAQTYDTPNKLVALGDSKRFVSTFVMHKYLFALIGGLGSGTQQEIAASLVRYAQTKKLLGWYSVGLQGRDTQKVKKLGSKQQRELERRIAFDAAIAHGDKLSFYGKIKRKYYRIYQFSTLTRWLFLRDVSLYLKCARLKNLVLFAFTLRRKALALELKHIRNEVIIHTTPGDVERQKRVIKQRVEALLKNPKDMPVFIICRDRVDSLKLLVDWLEKQGLKKIVFIDNDSVYPPLVNYFKTTPYQVLRLYRNVGHTSPWTLALTRALVPEDFYIVSDPDVIPTEECPKDTLQHFLKIHRQYLPYQKVGFGLRIDDLPDHYPLKDTVIEWEGQFWKHALEIDFDPNAEAYEAGVDTTFAMYKPFTYSYTLHPSIRTGFPYVARHLPWYQDPAKISDEEEHYRLRADSNVNSWNADTVADRYTKEMNKSKKKK